MSVAERGNITVAKKPLEKAPQVLKKLNFAAANYLAQHYINASAKHIAKKFSKHPQIKKKNPHADSSRKVWKYQTKKK